MVTTPTAASNVLRIAIVGEFTIFTAAAIREQLRAALGSAAEVEVDLAQVGEIDCAGVQLMLAAKREAAAQQTSIGFTGHSPAVLDILELCDLIPLLGVPLPTRA